QERERRQPLRRHSAVAAHPAVQLEDVLAVDVLLEGLDAELAREPIDRVLPRPDPGAAAIDPASVGTALGPDASADPIARLEHDDAAPRLGQPPRGGETRVARTDDADIGPEILHCPVSPPRGSAVSTDGAFVLMSGAVDEPIAG